MKRLCGGNEPIFQFYLASRCAARLLVGYQRAQVSSATLGDRLLQQGRGTLSMVTTHSDVG